MAKSKPARKLSTKGLKVKPVTTAKWKRLRSGYTLLGTFHLHYILSGPGPGGDPRVIVQFEVPSVPDGTKEFQVMVNWVTAPFSENSVPLTLIEFSAEGYKSGDKWFIQFLGALAGATPISAWELHIGINALAFG